MLRLGAPPPVSPATNRLTSALQLRLLHLNGASLKVSAFLPTLPRQHSYRPALGSHRLAQPDHLSSVKAEINFKLAGIDGASLSDPRGLILTPLDLVRKEAPGSVQPLLATLHVQLQQPALVLRVDSEPRSYL